MRKEIKMPRLGVNDAEVKLIKRLVENGAYVKKDQRVATIETSKEAGYLSCPEDGYIYFKLDEGEAVEVGKIAAVLESEIVNNSTQQQRKSKEPGIEATERALSLIEKYQINIEQLPTDRIIREKDVLKLIEIKESQIRKVNNGIFLYGGGGFCKICIDILRGSYQHRVEGIIDINFPSLKEVMGVPVIGSDNCLREWGGKGNKKCFNAVGFKNKGHWRKEPYSMLKSYGFEFVNIIHSKAVLEPSVRMGEGNLICAGAIIGSQVQIGDNCIINAGAIISHECIIGNHCHIASGAVLAGGVTVGENTLIGQGCTIYSGVEIGENVVIKNGCHIFKNIPANSFVQN